jgi:GWxTD domain-containing protein
MRLSQLFRTYWVLILGCLLQTNSSLTSELENAQSPNFKKWIEQDVAYIISKEERSAFVELQNDKDRWMFINKFWSSRDPFPETPENEYKNEHYRRILYANENFSTIKPGWMTDRGKAYILLGPPDSIYEHTSYFPCPRPPEEGGGTESSYPYEQWYFRHILNHPIKNEILLEFADIEMNGNFRLINNHSFEDLEKRVKGNSYSGNLTVKNLTESEREKNNSTSPFESNQERETFPIKIRADFFKATDFSTFVLISFPVEHRALNFSLHDGVMQACLELHGRVKNIRGEIIDWFKDEIEFIQPKYDPDYEYSPQSSLCHKSLSIPAGNYLLELVLKDQEGSSKGVLSENLDVPDFSDLRLTLSSIIQAAEIRSLSLRESPNDTFIIGGSRVVPIWGNPPIFDRIGFKSIYFQIYHLSTDTKPGKNLPRIEYLIKSGNIEISRFTEENITHSNPENQLTIKKKLPLCDLKKGNYTFTIRVVGYTPSQTVSKMVPFQIE